MKEFKIFCLLTNFLLVVEGVISDVGRLSRKTIPFLTKSEAHRFIKRSTRYDTGPGQAWKYKHHIDNECLEHDCVHEEVREYCVDGCFEQGQSICENDPAHGCVCEYFMGRKCNCRICSNYGTNCQQLSTYYQYRCLYGPETVTVTPSTQQDIVVGNPITNITCSASCSPTCTYKWFKQGVTAPVSNTSRLVLVTADKSDIGTYYCKATNAHGSRNSDNVVINILYGPETVTVIPLKQQNVVLGNPIPIITCSASCNPNCTYKWFKQGTITPVFNSRSLSLGTADKSERGTYYCKATNAHGNRNSDNIVISILYGPETVTVIPPKQQDVALGKPITTITCSASCNPNCTYKWFKQGMITPVSNSRSLSLGTADKSKRGTYYCKATNAHGNRNSDNIVISILYGPETVTVIPPKQQDVVLGKPITTITCSASCTPNCTYEWFKQGMITPVSNSRSLSLSTADKSEKGTYYCKATNAHGNRNSDNIVISILYPAYITNIAINDQADNQVEENSEVVIKCTVDSNPVPNIEWTFNSNGSVIQQDNTTRISELRFQKANCLDTGTYVCSAENGILQGDSRNITLGVKCKPRSDHRISQDNVTVKMLGNAQNINVTVAFVAFPVGDIVWSFQNTLNSENVTLSNGVSNVRIRNFKGISRTSSQLTRMNITEGDLGNYTATTANEYGSTSVVFVFITSISDKDNQSYIGKVVGSAVGSLVAFIILIVAVGVFVTCRRKQQSKRDKPIELNKRLSGSNYEEPNKTPHENTYEGISKQHEVLDSGQNEKVAYVEFCNTEHSKGSFYENVENQGMQIK